MITLAFFFCFSSVSVFCVVLTQKAPFRMLFFGVFGFGTVLFLVFADSPVLLDGVTQLVEIPLVLRTYLMFFVCS